MDKILFEGSVDRISSFNEVGPFDIYPMHANFISIIHDNISLFIDHQKINDFKIDQAILRAKTDKVDIYLGIESMLIKEEEEIEKVSKG